MGAGDRNSVGVLKIIIIGSLMKLQRAAFIYIAMSTDKYLETCYYKYKGCMLSLTQYSMSRRGCSADRELRPRAAPACSFKDFCRRLPVRNKLRGADN